MPRSVECVFVGYSASHKGYRCLDRATGRVYISRHVVFNEDAFPFATSLGLQSNTHVELVLYPTTVSPPVHPLPTVGPFSPAFIPPHHDIGPLSPSTCDPPPDTLAAPSSTQQPVLPSHPMVTRSKDGTRKPKTWHDDTVKYHLPHALSTLLALTNLHVLQRLIVNPNGELQ